MQIFEIRLLYFKLFVIILYKNKGEIMESKFTGGVLGLIGISLGMGLLTLVTFGIGLPWALCMRQRWISKHTQIDGVELVFDGKGGQLLGKYIVWVLLTIITLSIYSLWLPIKFQQWLTEHTHHVNKVN